MKEAKMSDRDMYKYLMYMRKYKPDIWRDLQGNKKVRKIMKKFESVNEKKGEFLDSLFPKAKVDKAIKIAKKMSGNMTGAVKAIEKFFPGMSKHTKVQAALRMANENIDKAYDKTHDALVQMSKALQKHGNQKAIRAFKKWWDQLDRFYPEANESVNEAGMELNKLKDAIKMFQKKIKKQGRVTNARDEEHLKNLIKVYKQMGGKGVKESVNEVSGVDVAKKVLKNKQREKGIDLQTANLIVTIDKAYDKNPKLQKKFRAIQLPKMKQLIMKYYG